MRSKRNHEPSQAGVWTCVLVDTIGSIAPGGCDYCRIGIEVFEHESAAEVVIPFQIGRVPVLVSGREMRLKHSHGLSGLGSVFHMHDPPQERAWLTSEGAFSVGRPQVDGGSNGLFGPIVEVVTEEGPTWLLSSMAATSMPRCITTRSQSFVGLKYPGSVVTPRDKKIWASGRPLRRTMSATSATKPSMFFPLVTPARPPRSAIPFAS